MQVNRTSRNVLVVVLLFGFTLACLFYIVFVYQPDTEELLPLPNTARAVNAVINCPPVYQHHSARTESVKIKVKLKNKNKTTRRPITRKVYIINTNYSDTRNNENNLDIWFSTFLLIIVPIRPSDKDSRQLIRDTWFEGYKSSQEVSLRFVVGIKKLDAKLQDDLTQENRTFGDIAFIDIAEGVDTLTNKTLGLINWAHRHVKFSYLLKADDDTFVFVENMIVELRKRPTDTKLYYGNIHIDNYPIRGNGKWADNKWDLSNTYLPFALGGGYILSHDLVAILSEVTPQLMWHINEDTAIGAWVSGFEHEQKSDGKFCLWWHGSKLPTDCRDPMLALLMFGHSNNDRRKHFHYFHDHSNTRIAELMKESSKHL